MSKINEQLLVMSNRIIDAVYIAGLKSKISYDAFSQIINHIEDIALMDIFKMYGTKPYKKRMVLTPVIDENKPGEDFKEYLNRVSLSLSDMLTTLEFHRDMFSKVKTDQKIYLKFFEKYKTDLNKITSVILAQQDLLMDLLESIDEIELGEKLESYLKKCWVMELTPEIYESVIRKILNDKNDITIIQFKDRYYEYVKDSRPSSVVITRGKNKGKILEAKYTRDVIYTLNKFIKHTGNVLIKDITSNFVEQYILKLFTKSKYSAALDFRILRSAFQKAVDWNLIVTNPFSKIKLPKIQKNPPKYLTREQLEKVLKHTPKGLNDVFRFAFLTGIRLSELTNLSWKNVNIKEKIIQIGDETFTTKSRKTRVIPVCDEAANILTNRVPRIFDKNKPVFCKTNKVRFTNDWLSKAFKRALRKTDLDSSIHFHSLRHSFASNLVKDGASIYHLKELLGHSSVSVTEIYSHLNVESLRATVNKFNSVASN